MKKTVTLLLCDWHGDNTEADRTVRITDGKAQYDLDLCADCRAEIRAGARRVASNRRAAARKTSRRKVAATSNGNGHLPSSKEVREWAAQQKIAVSDKGRVPNAVVAQYEAATH